MKNDKLESILDAAVKCPACDWNGTIRDAEPDVDGDGSPGCPKCLSILIGAHSDQACTKEKHKLKFAGGAIVCSDCGKPTRT